MNETELIKSILNPQGGLECAIIADPEFVKGVTYGKPRKGHPEGQVMYHIQEVLENVEKYYKNDEDYQDLRIIAFIHDSFKHKVDQNQPKVGENHHGMIARRFAQNFSIHEDVLTVIQHHDDAYNAWQRGGRHGDWYAAKKKATNLIQALMIEGCLDLYVKFYRCDNETGDKSSDNFEWFENLIS